MARIVARDPEHAVRREHYGTQVKLSMQVAGPEQRPGLLVVRRSGVRFPKAAQGDGQSHRVKPEALLVSLLDGIPYARSACQGWRRRCLGTGER
jgi:hypothetical protein